MPGGWRLQERFEAACLIFGRTRLDAEHNRENAKIKLPMPGSHGWGHRELSEPTSRRKLVRWWSGCKA